jgi:hypothetical protein
MPSTSPVIPSPAAPSVPSRSILAIPVEIQQEMRWCWCAACTIINNYYEGAAAPGTSSQCRVAALQIAGIDCCANPGACNRQGSLERALQDVGHLRQQVPGAADAVGGYPTIRQEIGVLLRPVAVRVAIPGGSHHFVVIYGYDDADTSLLLWNPTFGNVHTTFGDSRPRSAVGRTPT